MFYFWLQYLHILVKLLGRGFSNDSVGVGKGSYWHPFFYDFRLQVHLAPHKLVGMAELLHESVSILQTGNAASIREFCQRKDVYQFFKDIGREAGCQILKVSVVSVFVNCRRLMDYGHGWTLVRWVGFYFLRFWIFLPQTRKTLGT